MYRNCNLLLNHAENEVPTPFLLAGVGSNQHDLGNGPVCLEVFAKCKPGHGGDIRHSLDADAWRRRIARPAAGDNETCNLAVFDPCIALGRRGRPSLALSRVVAVIVGDLVEPLIGYAVFREDSQQGCFVLADLLWFGCLSSPGGTNAAKRFAKHIGRDAECPGNSAIGRPPGSVS